MRSNSSQNELPFGSLSNGARIGDFQTCSREQTSTPLFSQEFSKKIPDFSLVLYFSLGSANLFGGNLFAFFFPIFSLLWEPYGTLVFLGWNEIFVNRLFLFAFTISLFSY